MMFKKIAIVLYTTLLVFYANAQKAPVQYFFTEKDNREYDGNYTACAVKLFADSTILIRVYTMPRMQYNPPMSKTSYFGKYYQQNDSCRIRYWSSYSETRDFRLQLIKKPEVKNNIPGQTSIVIYPDLHFIIKDGKFFLSGVMIPVLPASSAMVVNTAETNFQQWGKTFRQNKFTEDRLSEIR